MVTDSSIPSASPVVGSQSESTPSIRFRCATAKLLGPAGFKGENAMSNVTEPLVAAAPGDGVPLARVKVPPVFPLAGVKGCGVRRVRPLKTPHPFTPAKGKTGGT